MARKLPSEIKSIRIGFGQILNEKRDEIVCIDPVNRFFALNKFIFQQAASTTLRFVDDVGEIQVIPNMPNSLKTHLNRLRLDCNEKQKMKALFSIGKRLEGEYGPMTEYDQLTRLSVAGKYVWKAGTGGEYVIASKPIFLVDDEPLVKDYRLDGYEFGVAPPTPEDMKKNEDTEVEEEEEDFNL